MQFDYVGLVTAHLDAFTQGHSGLLIGLGFTWLTGVFFLMAFKTFAMWGLFRRGDPFDVGPLVVLFVRWTICFFLLSFYDTPLPGAGVSVHQVFSEEARYIASLIDLSIINTLTGLVTAAFVKMEKPSWGNLLGLYTYVEISFWFVLIYVLSFVVTVLGFAALGVGSLLGPIFIPWLLVPSFEFLFWGWIRFMILYSLWRVVSAALINVWANVLVDFFTATLNGNYTLGYFLGISPGLAVLVIGFAVTMMSVYFLARDLVSGSASLGSPVGSVARFAGAVAAAV